ncbi:MAG: hypothetical protein DRP46_04175 [Candidatus Zixiibacteriota bacterium]|nr:MAG: hypothetical protein DRP46_04175 [candidate division Zixibacteria bacterium]
MGFIPGINRLIGLYAAALKAIFRFKLWPPFFLLAIMQFIVLLIFRSYVNPYVYPILSPLVGLLGEKNAAIFSQYPGLYIALPFVFQWGKLVLGILFEGFAIGWASMLFMRYFHARKDDSLDFRAVLYRWPQLAVAWTLVTAVIIVINTLLPELFAGQLIGSPRRIIAFETLLRLLAVAVYALFIYAVPSIVVYKNNILKAFKTSLSLFFRFPIFTFFLALIPYLFTVPTSYLSGKSTVIVDKFTPELIFYVLAVGLVIDMLVNFFLTTSVVNFLIEEEE